MIEEPASNLVHGILVGRMALDLGAAAGQDLASGQPSSLQRSSATAGDGFARLPSNASAIPAFSGLQMLDWPVFSSDPELLYLSPEPTRDRDIPGKACAEPRSKIGSNTDGISGATNRFSVSLWREWLLPLLLEQISHFDRLIARLQP